MPFSGQNPAGKKAPPGLTRCEAILMSWEVTADRQKEEELNALEGDGELSLSFLEQRLREGDNGLLLGRALM